MPISAGHDICTIKKMQEGSFTGAFSVYNFRLMLLLLELKELVFSESLVYSLTIKTDAAIPKY